MKTSEYFQSSRHFWALFFGLNHARLAAKFPNKVVRPIQYSGVVLVFLLGCTLVSLAIWGFTPEQGALNHDLIWGAFIQGPFIIQTLLLVVWFIVSIKPKPSRLEEFRFLLSLPISPERIFHRFFLSDIFRFSWIPILFSVSLLGLTPVSSLAFLSRPILLSAVFFLLCLALMLCLQLILCFGSAKSAAPNYLTRCNPVVQGAVLVVFAGALLMIMLIPMSVSNLSYWTMLLALVFATLFLVAISKRLFVVLYARNHWMKTARSCEQSTGVNDSLLVRILGKGLSAFNPLLFKNIIQSQRSRTRFSRLMLATGFVSAAYLMAMNNQNWEDTISVLLGLNIIYIVWYSSATINRFSPEVEPTQITFTFPISKLQFYFSVFVPALTWVLLVSAVMAFLIVVSGGGLSSAVEFWLKSILAGSVLLGIAMNSGVANYPNLKRAHKHFGYWLLVLIITSALLYKYRVEVAVVVALLSSISALRLNLFSVPELLTKHSYIRSHE